MEARKAWSAPPRDPEGSAKACALLLRTEYSSLQFLARVERVLAPPPPQRSLTGSALKTRLCRLLCLIGTIGGTGNRMVLAACAKRVLFISYASESVAQARDHDEGKIATGGLSWRVSRAGRVQI